MNRAEVACNHRTNAARGECDRRGEHGREHVVALRIEAAGSERYAREPENAEKDTELDQVLMRCRASRGARHTAHEGDEATQERPEKGPGHSPNRQPNYGRDRERLDSIRTLRNGCCRERRADEE